MFHTHQGAAKQPRCVLHNNFFNGFDRAIDEETFTGMLRSFYFDIDKEFHPEFFGTIERKYLGDFDKFASDIYRESVFSSKESVLKLLELFSENSIKADRIIGKDPLIQIFSSYSKVYSIQVIPFYDALRGEMDVLYRTYIRGLKEMQNGKVMYPDANFTMRVAFGKVEGYKPADAVEYEYSTNLSGVIEKYNTDSVVYSLPAKLLELYNVKDYGKWADNSGEIPVCFSASNHTSGGNSGSAVLDADGHLIGLNFDRNWEGTMSDVYYDVSICRNIAVDIRYILFIIDKYAGAGYLIDEMDVHFD